MSAYICRGVAVAAAARRGAAVDAAAFAIRMKAKAAVTNQKFKSSFKTCF